jgi:hypothetical protein
MKEFSLSILCLIACLTLIVTCDDDSAGPENKIDALVVADFPNAAGIRWDYEVFDSIANNYDTVTVTTEECPALSNWGNALLWIYHYPDWTDTTYVYIHNDTVHFCNDSTLQGCHRIYVFPIKVGSFWWVNPEADMVDTSFIVRKGDVATKMALFKDGFCIMTSWHTFLDGGTVETWVVADVGIVKWNYRQAIEKAVVEKWELIAYQPPLLR